MCRLSEKWQRQRRTRRSEKFEFITELELTPTEIHKIVK